ncbi:hypothetical protein BY458DRAFT_512964 [Sporodiniella umbellata]|nr:hypothetical protein BY458DRAFT_512964 [Sporodiniella umbellata]
MHAHTLKIRWNVIKAWFATLEKQRRGSEDSEASVLSENKRPSLAGSESLSTLVNKCKFGFRYRTSSVDHLKDVVEKYAMAQEDYAMALLEYKYAMDSNGSLYYPNDRLAAQEALTHCQERWIALLDQCNPHQRTHFDLDLGKQIRQLEADLALLPLPDSHL